MPRMDRPPAPLCPLRRLAPPRESRRMMKQLPACHIIPPPDIRDHNPRNNLLSAAVMLRTMNNDASRPQAAPPPKQGTKYNGKMRPYQALRRLNGFRDA